MHRCRIKKSACSKGSYENIGLAVNLKLMSVNLKSKGLHAQ